MTEESNKLVDAYERFAQKTRDLLEESQDKTAQALEKAMEAARENLEKAEEISQEEGQRLKAFLKRDLEQTAKDIQSIEAYTVEHFKPSSIKMGFYNLLSYLSHNSADVFDRLAEWADKEVEVHTGEVTGPATLQCSACKSDLHFKESGRVPPCPKCHKTEFRRTG
ncbi:MAG: hypothetical protein C9356_14125 [Oleiphilus sp.]|nr:MAG: hypothetical protein C9356_14125 [Oleiphilus sp.]